MSMGCDVCDYEYVHLPKPLISKTEPFVPLFGTLDRMIHDSMIRFCDHLDGLVQRRGTFNNSYYNGVGVSEGVFLRRNMCSLMGFALGIKYLDRCMVRISADKGLMDRAYARIGDKELVDDLSEFIMLALSFELDWLWDMDIYTTRTASHPGCRKGDIGCFYTSEELSGFRTSTLKGMLAHHKREFMRCINDQDSIREDMHQMMIDRIQHELDIRPTEEESWIDEFNLYRRDVKQRMQ